MAPPRPALPAIPEEGAMPVVTHRLPPVQSLPCAALVLFVFLFISAMLPILVLVLLKELSGSWTLVADMAHLFFGDVLLF